VAAVEALVRWDRSASTADGSAPTRTLVPPDEFVPLAEETGLIVPIGSWVLPTAAQQVSRWQASPGSEHLGLAVNVSARQLLHPGFVHLVEEVIADTGIVASSLCLELTETVLLDDVEQSRDRLAELRDLGIRIAMDDFGTGYSSLTYLHRLPLDVVKLDRSFVAGVGSDAGDTAIVSAVVELARTMGIDAVAEGIETDLQLGHLRGLGCRHGQGFLLARPMAAEDLEGWLRRHAAGGVDGLDGSALRTAGRDGPAPGPGRSDPATSGSPAGSPPA
jgi:EAL domain-containing protein (putative c-di-GMP-specific phosphodiesterase class I)